MNIEVYAALRFRTATALEKGLAAFDASAFPEFFTRDLWTVSGPLARCKQTFEIEADCNYTTAFLAMALQATEGAVYLRVAGDTKKLVRIHRAKLSKGSWMNLTDETGLHPFGYYVDATEAVWAEASHLASR